MNVHAIIVGIEHYDALADGVDIELDGPASDAVHFAIWLLSRGVPPANLHLFLSSLDPKARRAELDRQPKGNAVVFNNATRDRVETFFNVELRNLVTTPSVLFVLWGGHGVMRHGREHHLFYENFRKGSPLTFNLEGRLRQLRTFGDLEMQHIFIDACANYVELTQFGDVDSTNPNAGIPDPTVTQHLLMAAASGQKARNDRIERTGVFSRELFNLIDQDKSGEWPSAEKLAPKLEQVFLEKGRNDRSFRQRPVWLHFRPNQGGGFELGGHPKPNSLQELASLAGCSISQLDMLARVLAKSETLNNPRKRDELYELVIGKPKNDRSWRNDPEFDRVGLAAWVLHRGKTRKLAKALDRHGDSSFREIEITFERVDLARKVIQLLDPIGLSTKQYLDAFRRIPDLEDGASFFEDTIMNLAGRGALSRSPIYRFLLDVSRSVDAPNLLKIETFVGKANASYLADLRQEFKRNRSYRLLVSAKHEPKSIWGMLLENDLPIGQKAIRALNEPRDLLTKLEEIYLELLSDITGDISVELILPFEYLCEDVESAGITPKLPIPIPQVPICHRYPVVLRWRDRIMKPGVYQGEKWIRTAQHVRNRLQEPGSKPSLCSLPENPDTLFWNKISEPKGDLLDLGFQYPSAANEVLANVLYHGTAFACWSRTPPTGAEMEYEKLVKDLVAGGPFLRIPRRAVETRQAAIGIRSLALLWDDPETNPKEFISSFEEIK